MTFAVTGLAIGIFGWPDPRDGALPAPARIALVAAVLLVVVFVGRLTVLNPKTNVIRIAALRVPARAARRSSRSAALLRELLPNGSQRSLPSRPPERSRGRDAPPRSRRGPAGVPPGRSGRRAGGSRRSRHRARRLPRRPRRSPFPLFSRTQDAEQLDDRYRDFATEGGLAVQGEHRGGRRRWRAAAR